MSFEIEYLKFDIGNLFNLVAIALPAGRQVSGRAPRLNVSLEFYVYILKSKKDNGFYTGQTLDIEKRLKEHNKGDRSTGSTLNRGPFELIHVEIVSTLKEARNLEKYFKSGYGREVRNEIVENIWWL